MRSPLPAMLLGAIAGGVFGWVAPIVFTPPLLYGLAVLIPFLGYVIPASAVVGAVLFGVYRLGAKAAARLGREPLTSAVLGLVFSAAVATTVVVACGFALGLFMLPILLWAAGGAAAGAILGAVWALVARAPAPPPAMLPLEVD